MPTKGLLNDVEINIDNVGAALGQERSKAKMDTVLLRADRRVPFDYVVAAISAARAAGIVDIAVETGEGQNGAELPGGEGSVMIVP